MKYLYSQLNPEWANLKVGQSGKTLGQIGCLLTNCAMVISDLTDKEHTPKMLLEWMNINDGFEESGDLRWWILTAYPPRKYDFHIIKIPMTDDEIEYRMDAVWAGKIKHWILKDGDKWIDPLTGGYIPMTKYKFYGDIRILSGLRLQPIMNYENKIIRNTDTGGFALVVRGKKYVFSGSQDVSALLTFLQRSGVDDNKIINVDENEFNKIPLSDGLNF